METDDVIAVPSPLPPAQSPDDRPELVPGPGGAIGVLGAVLAVKRALLGGVGKGDTHGQDFSYRSADSVVNALAEPLLDAELILVPFVTVGDRHFFVTKTGNNDSLLMHHVKYALFFTDGSHLLGKVSAQAQGNTGYASGAAMSYAYKYFVSQVFNIPFDDVRMELDSLEAKDTIAGQASPPQDAWQRAGWANQGAHDMSRNMLMGFLKGKKRLADETDDGSPARAERDRIREFLKGIDATVANGQVRALLTAQHWSQIEGELFAGEPFGTTSTPTEPTVPPVDGAPAADPSQVTEGGTEPARPDRQAELLELLKEFDADTDAVPFDELCSGFVDYGVTDPMDVAAILGIAKSDGHVRSDVTDDVEMWTWMPGETTEGVEGESDAVTQAGAEDPEPEPDPEPVAPGGPPSLEDRIRLAFATMASSGTTGPIPVNDLHVEFSKTGERVTKKLFKEELARMRIARTAKSRRVSIDRKTVETWELTK